MKLRKQLHIICVAALSIQPVLPAATVFSLSPARVTEPAPRPLPASPLPAWFSSTRGETDAQKQAVVSPLPAWFASTDLTGLEDLSGLSTRFASLPAWFAPPSGPVASPPLRPLAASIPESQLTVGVSGPPVASLGAPIGAGETYTAVIRNNSSSIAYNAFFTATHQPFFIHDGDDALTGGTGPIPFSVLVGTSTITWTPVTTLTLGMGEAITLTFRLRATCGAESGQQMRVGIRYNDDPALPPNELNDGGLNITTGRGNLVIKKEPAIQNLGTPDFGQPVTWTVTVQNTGLGKLYGALITDTGGISLSQPSGGLVPTATIPVLDVNQAMTFTVVGTVEACNFTNVALGAWTCGNLVGDATASNPVSSTASILFTPQIPNVSVQVSSPITFPYCAPLTRAVAVTATIPAARRGTSASIRLWKATRSSR
jgi:hypothetical protein